MVVAWRGLPARRGGRGVSGAAGVQDVEACDRGTAVVVGFRVRHVAALRWLALEQLQTDRLACRWIVRHKVVQWIRMRGFEILAQLRRTVHEHLVLQRLSQRAAGAAPKPAAVNALFHRLADGRQKRCMPGVRTCAANRAQFRRFVEGKLVARLERRQPIVE